MQLKQVIFGVSERGNAAVRAHVATRKVSSTKPLDPLPEHSRIDRVEYDHAAARVLGRLGW
jgi:hypothetical protein